MATVTSFIDGTIGEKHVATVGVTNKKFYTENTIDLSLLNSGSADVIQCLNIPKGAFVTNVGVYKLTIEDSTLTGIVGDADNDDGWLDTAVNFENLGNVNSLVSDAYPALGGKLYTVADTIDVTMSANAGNTAKFTVFAEYSIVESVANA